MYIENAALTPPANENTMIWRYLDFTKFVSLLDKKSLFFARADTFEDKYEGANSEANIAYFEDTFNTPEQRKEYYEKLKRCLVINSWHMNEHESAAMWKLYLKNTEGIAIRSTFKRLTESSNNDHENHVHIGEIKYIDYAKELIPRGDPAHLFAHKRKSFEHDRELRAVVGRLHGSLHSCKPKEQLVEFPRKGVYVPFDVNMLVDKIFVAPTAQQWFKDLVESVCKKYNLHKEVKQSDLDKDPLY